MGELSSTGDEIAPGTAKQVSLLLMYKPLLTILLNKDIVMLQGSVSEGWFV